MIGLRPTYRHDDCYTVMVMGQVATPDDFVFLNCLLRKRVLYAEAGLFFL